MDYTPQELMVVCAARQIQDGEHVFVGMRLPLLAFALAKRTHAPRCLGLFEAGILRDEPAAELLYTMGDAPNITGALWATGTVKMIGLMAAGEVQLGFIGGAEIDRYGNLNTTVIGNWQKPAVRLPGDRGVRRARRQHPVRRLVARRRGGAGDRGLGGHRGTASLGREILRVRSPARSALLTDRCHPQSITPPGEAPACHA